MNLLLAPLMVLWPAADSMIRATAAPISSPRFSAASITSSSWTCMMSRARGS